MKNFFKFSILIAGFVFLFNSCIKDLDTVPIDKDEITAASVYKDPASYKQILAKLYAGLAVSGQKGPAGSADISGIDEGFGQYLRGYWYHQELPTDEAVIGWNDQTVKDFHYQTWGTSDVFIAAMYYRIFYQVALCNEFIRETTDAKLSERGITGSIVDDIKHFRAEARFLRALSYWHALDLFGNVPFVTENDAVGAFFPMQITRTDLFNYIESELIAIDADLMDAHTNEYGRADKAAAWTLLAKIYLNAKVYTNSEKFTECITACKKVIEAGYTLEPNYQNLFLADNNTSNEIIFPISFDGVHTKTWGGMTFIIHAAVGGDMAPGDYGIDGGWGGTRTTKALVHKFYPDLTKGLWSSVKAKKSPYSYASLGVPGSHQGWNPADTSTVVSSVLDDGNYEGYFWFAAGTQFKFTQGGTWDVNWGDTGADGTLDAGGDNINVADDGYYKINVDLNALTYTIVKTDWGLIGSATPDGWNSDQNMTYDQVTGLWNILVDLVAGEVKFRANDDWAINYGDNGPNGILEAGGSNIVIPMAGTYTITMKLGHPDYSYSIVQTDYDRRALFHSSGQNLEINDISTFSDGYAVAKFKNLTSGGQNGSDLTFPDTDFPMFRLADVYLMYAEAVLRGGTGGDMGTAVNYVNQVRERAYQGTGGNITAGELNLDFIIDERARELFWEGHRRTDLIRFEQFTGGSYLWPWKGFSKDGVATDGKYNLFPIPDSDVAANPNLTQNSGY